MLFFGVIYLMTLLSRLARLALASRSYKHL